MKILVTGVNGFIGKFLCKELLKLGHGVVALSRSAAALNEVENFCISLENINNHLEIFNGVECVVHLAARVHKKDNKSADALTEFRAINCEATLALARHAAAAGVKRIIFLSTINVNGESNARPFVINDIPKPEGPYAQSKWEAEEGLKLIQKNSGIELVIIRLPLVYGPNAPGNFGKMVSWIERGVPLPLGSIFNKRSLVGLNNLISLIVCCLDHKKAANQVLFAGDGEDVSTTELLRLIGQAMGQPAHLLPVPEQMLRLAATILGQRAAADKLLGSLQVDISETCSLLDWHPPHSIEDGMRLCFSEK